ncbi:MAG: hypothetical protein FJ279_33415, partial [Planctomycetes bacterium]|nr:hypothetical protein [Planctomycetota bacterium]
MRKHITCLALLTVVGGVVAAAEVVKTPPEYLILKPKKAVVVDGKLDEWDMAKTPYTISAVGKNPMNSLHSNEPTNPVKSDEDFSGRAALAWDETYLYVAGEMTDDHLLGVKPDSAGNEGPPGWGCDSLMISVASFRQPLKSNTPYNPIPFLALRYAPMGPNPRGKLSEAYYHKTDLHWMLTKGSKWAVSETAKGYNVEAAIPWADLAFTARPGERLFIAFLAADIDPDESLNQVGWGFKGEPKEHPVFRLADREDVLGMLTVSSDEVATNKPWAARVELDARKAAAKLDAVRVVDADGRKAVEQAATVQVPEGMTGIELVEFKAGAVAKPGRYVVQAVSAGNVVAAVPVRIVEPTPEPPMIKNLPGEIHHMGPDRVVHNAYAEHQVKFYRHGWVKGKEDYVPYIRKHVEPGLKDHAANAIKTKSKWAFMDAFRCMALHRITDDAEYVQLARDCMDRILDQLQGEITWHHLTATTVYRFLTWKQDPSSPFVPHDAEKRYRQGLCNVAAKPGNGLFNESGTHNRVWHRYAIQKVAR